MMTKIKRVVAQTFALALAIGATGGAWAATANVVWENDFGTSVKTGLDGKTYTLSLPDSSWLQGNGTIQIGSRSDAQGATIAVSDGVSGEKLSVLVEYSGAVAQSSSATPIYVAEGTWFGLATKASSLDVVAHWWNNSGTIYPTGSNPATTTAMPAAGYLLFVFNQGAADVQAYSAMTRSGLPTNGGYVKGLNFSGKTLAKIGLGGVFSGADVSQLTSNSVASFDGLVIKRVAIFSSAISVADAASYVFPSELEESYYDYVATISDNTDFSSIASWTKGEGTPGSSAKILINNSATLTLSGNVDLGLLHVQGGSVVLADGASVNATELRGSAGVAVNASAVVSISDSAIDSPIANRGTINTSGTVSLNGANTFYNGSTLDVKTGMTTLYSTDQGLKGTIYIRKDAELIGTRSDSMTYGASASEQAHLHIYGKLTLKERWTVGSHDYIHLYSTGSIDDRYSAGSSNGSVTKALHFNTGTGVFVVEEDGDYVISTPFATEYGTAKVEVKGNATLTLNSLPNNLKIEKAGTGTLKWANKVLGALSGTGGTIEISSTSGNFGHTFTGSTYDGVLKLINTASNQNNLAPSAPCFADGTRPELNMDCSQTYLSKAAYDGCPLYVRNLSGTSRSMLDARTTEGPLSFTLDTLQERDTEFLGIFNNNSGDNRTYALNVTGNNVGGVHTLTLGGVNASTNTLTVSNYAKVKFSSTGKWSKGIVVVDDKGVIETQNPESIAARLVIKEGATLAFADGVSLSAADYDWSNISTDESVSVDLSSVTPLATPVTLIASNVNISVSRFKSSIPLSVDANGALKATYAGNTWKDGTWVLGPTVSGDADMILSRNATLSLAENLELGAVTVKTTTDDPVTLTVSGSGALTATSISLPSNVTLKIDQTGNWTVPISGDGKVAVAANAVTFTTANTFTGGLMVLEGGLAQTTVATGFGDVSQAVTVLSGGSVDIANTASTAYSLNLAGQGVYDSTAEKYLGAAFSSVAYGDQLQLGGITLSANATIVCDNNWGLITNEHGTTTLNLDAFTLTKKGAANFWLCNTTISGSGAIDIVEGAISTVSSFSQGNYNGVNSETIYVRNGASLLVENAGLKYVKNVVCDVGGRISAERDLIIENGGTLVVNGTLDVSGAQGTLNIGFNDSASLTVGGTINLVGASVMELKAASGITKTGTGVINVGSEASVTWHSYTWSATAGDVFAGTGTLNLEANTSAFSECTTTSSFAGKLNIIGNASKVPYFGAGSHQFMAKPELSLTGYMTLNYNFIGESNAFTVKNLTGASGSRVDPYNNSGNNGERFISTLQTNDTAFAGNFTGDASRQTALLVYGEAATGVKSLTIAAANDTPGTLVIDNYGKVIYNDNGSWLNGTNIVRNGGVLESQRDALVVGALTLEAGAVLEYGDDSEAIQASGALTLPDIGTVTVDVSSLTIDTSTSKTLLSASSGINLSKFNLLGSETHMLTASGSTTLLLEPIAATVTSGDGLTVQTYTTPNAALERLSSLQQSGEDLNAYATVILGSTTYTAEQLAAYNIIYDSTNSRYVIAEAKISSTLYITIEEAITDATAGDVIEITKNISKANIAVNKAIEFSEGNYTFTGSFTGSGTITLSALLKSPAAARWASGWTGTVVLPAIDSIAGDTFNFNNYGKSGSTVRVTTIGGGWLSAETINPTIDIETSFALTDFSASRANTFTKITGSGAFSVNSSAASVDVNNEISDKGWSWYNGCSAYFLVNDISEFRGSITVNNVGLAVGSSKPAYDTIGAKIIINSGKAATVASGKTWTASNGIVVDGTLTLAASTSTLSGTVTGSGRIICDGSLPSVTGLTDSSNWTGTVELKNYEEVTDGNRIIKLNLYGNANSTVALNGVTSTIFANSSKSSNNYPDVTLKEIEIGAGGWTDNGGSSYTYNADMFYTAKLTGHGPLTVKTQGTGTVKFIGNHTFDGSVAFDSGCEKQVAFMKTSSDAIPDVTAKAIVVAGGLDMSIASGKTWTATGGIKLDGSLTVLTEEEATATSGTISAYRNGASVYTTRDAVAGTTTYKSTPVIEISDNQASLGDVSINANYVLSGSGGAYMSSLAIADGASLTYDPVITPLYVNATPTFTGTGKLKLASRYAGVTCGKFHLVTYPASASVTGTLNDLVDSTSFNNATYTVTEETVKVVTVNSSAVSGYTETPYKQLVLKVGNYDTAAKEMSIAQFGDSITEGIWRNNDGSGTAYRGTPNYRIPLMQLLEAYGYKPEARGYRKVGSQDANGVKADDNYEWHTGISAQRIYTGNTYTWAFRAGFMESIEAHLEQVGVTDVITLKIGTNDSIGNETADNMFEGWTNLVWKIVRMRPTSKIVVCTPITMRQAENNAPGLRTKIAEYMAKSAAEGGFPDDQVTMISGEEIVTGDASDYLDNVHPNWNGHMKLANAWLPAVTNAFESMKVGDVIVHADSGVYTPQTVASAENATELAAYRAGYVKLATFTNFNGKVSTWGETPYYYVNDTYTNTPIKRVAYFVARKTTASPDTRYVWVDMDADETTTGTTLADFGVPKSASVNCVVSNLHIYSNSSAIENVAPEVDGVKGTLMLTEKGVSGAAGISSADAPAGVTWDSSKAVFDWNDSIVDSPTWGVMSVARTFDGVEPTNHRKLLAAQMLFDFNGFNGTMTNAFGLGDFAVHGPYDYANNSVDNFNLNWTFMTAKDEMPTMDARAVETGVIEIWGQLDLTPAFTYDAYTGGTGPTGWFSSWGGEQFKTDRFRIGPNAGPNTNYVYYVFHDSDNSKAHPWVGLNNDTIKSGSFSFAIYADVSQMESDKGVIVAFGNTSNGLILYREDAYVKLAHVVNGAITTTDWVPGVAVLSGYHLYTVSYDTQTGEAKLYLDNMACAATTGEGIYRHLVTTDSQKGLNAGFQIGAIYQGFEYNSTQTGFTFGSGLAVCAVRGFDVPLSQPHVDVLADEFPATNGTITWDVNPDTLSQGVSYTYLVTSATVDDAHYLGVTHGKLTIPEGSTVNAKLFKVLNSNATSNNAVVDIAGTLNVTASTSSHDIWGNQSSGGILLGHWKGTGMYNITGSLIGRDSYMEMVYSAGSQTINVTGGVMAVKGYWARLGNVTVNLTDGGTIEVKDILTAGVAPAQNFGYGTFRLASQETPVERSVAFPISFTGTETQPTTLDPNGNTLTVGDGMMLGTGDVTVNAPNGGTVVFAGNKTFSGHVILTDENADNIDLSGYNGKVLLNGTNSTTIAKLEGFTGTVMVNTPGTYNARGVDLSGVNITIGSNQSGVVFEATAGLEGTVTVFLGICNLYVDNDMFLYEGHIFNGGVMYGSLNYYHSEDSSISGLDYSANSQFSASELAVVRPLGQSMYNILPYFKIFVGDSDGNAEYSGSTRNPVHWQNHSSEDIVPTTGNAAFKVEAGKTLIVNVTTNAVFGDVQIAVTGNPGPNNKGTVVFRTDGDNNKITVTNGFYTSSMYLDVTIESGVEFSLEHQAGIHVLTQSTVTIDSGTESDRYEVPYIGGYGTIIVANDRYVAFDKSEAYNLLVNGNVVVENSTATVANRSSFRVSQELTVNGTMTMRNSSTEAALLVVTVNDGGVLNLYGSRISANALHAMGTGLVQLDSDSLLDLDYGDASVKAVGDGTVRFVGKRPDGEWWTNAVDSVSTGWRGTVAVKDWDYSSSNNWKPADYGNQYSTLEADNCKVYYFAGSGSTLLPKLNLAGNLTIYNGGSQDVNNFAGLSGSGSLTIVKPAGSPTQTLRFATGADFSGSITNATFKLVFGTSGGENATITVNSGVTAGLGTNAVWKSDNIKISGILDVKNVGTLEVGTDAANAVTVNGGATIKLADEPLNINGKMTLPTSGTMTVNAWEINDADATGVSVIAGITDSESLTAGMILTNVTVYGAADASLVVAKTNEVNTALRDIAVYKRLPVSGGGATDVKVPIKWMKDNASTALAGETTIAGYEAVIRDTRSANGCKYIESYALGLTPSDSNSVPAAGMSVNGENFEIFLSNAVVPKGVTLTLSADTKTAGGTYDDAGATPVSVNGNNAGVSGTKVSVPIPTTPGVSNLYQLKVGISGTSDPTP